MNKELVRAFEWLEHRHNTIKELAAHNKTEFKSEWMQGVAEGERVAAEFYGEQIKKIRQLIDGYMIEDVDLSGGEEHAS
jgi:hypothetical protein